MSLPSKECPVTQRNIPKRFWKHSPTGKFGSVKNSIFHSLSRLLSASYTCPQNAMRDIRLENQTKPWCSEGKEFDQVCPDLRHKVQPLTQSPGVCPLCSPAHDTTKRTSVLSHWMNFLRSIPQIFLSQETLVSFGGRGCHNRKSRLAQLCDSPSLASRVLWLKMCVTTPRWH